ncbi:MAG: polyphosphate kinase 2 family protein [Ignavibacteria bacterium]|nr:polyphosphate kinase 2 family protein [Ignavibacteria bacterium]
MNADIFLVPPRQSIKLKDYNSAYTGEFKNKKEAKEKLKSDIKKLSKLQDILFASSTYSVLVILQAMDAAGKDGLIKHVMSGLNPQGCQVYSFKVPSEEELKHDYMWRCINKLPERGHIGIFNRSYYEEVLVVKVHPELLNRQNLPLSSPTDSEIIWKMRYEQINNFEKYLFENGTIIIKFFLHLSKDEQKNRFLKRIDIQEKNWKFSLGDIKEREFWEDYQKAYEDMLSNTSTPYAPWYILPADNKWYTRLAAAQIIISKLESLNLSYPKTTEEHLKELEKAKILLENEDGLT